MTVNSDHDVAIEVRSGPRAAIYVVHCIPPEFPDVSIETRTSAVSEGLLLMTPSVRRSDKSFLAIVDNNGVPRWVTRPNVRARNDIVAGLRGCAQVLRIDGTTGAVVWQMGGSLPMRTDRPMPPTGATRYLPVVDDPEGEFCGQHHVTATAAGSVLMFDNGAPCQGPRKDRPRSTRIVEYDISSGTAARFVREYRLPEADGFAESGGGVTAQANGNWLITWGNNGPSIAISEVDTRGNEIFRVSMTKDGVQYGTGRVYREPESALGIPLNLPSQTGAPARCLTEAADSAAGCRVGRGRRVRCSGP